MVSRSMYSKVFAPGWLRVALVLAMGCRPSTGSVDDSDDLGGFRDASMQMVHDTTVRDLNAGRHPSGTMVRVTGVVISPFTWIDISPDQTACRYSAYIAQPAPSPSLADGMHLYFARREMPAPDMGLNVSRCREVARDWPIYTIASGHKVEVTGRFEISPAGYRQIFVPGGGGIKDLGMGEAIQPVEAATRDFVNGNAAAFRDHKAALVRFSNVRVSDSQTMFPYGFKVAPPNQMDKATMTTSYLRVRTSNYMPPPNDTELASVTGIALPDFGGTVWIRTPQDIVPR
ncbi:MAG: hypothetical protein RMK29_14845 [Myxococcales bacterium]|nr:hypothetical protein [Myxococcota bacterium]MDW8282991.1 hypothetical protein [Myxococcales bacterium]